MEKPQGIPHAYPGKAEMLDEYEHAEKVAAEQKKLEQSLKRSNQRLPDGQLESVPETMRAKVIQQQEDEEMQNLTKQEVQEAERLMVQEGEIESQREIHLSRRAYYKELQRVLKEA